MGYFRSDLKNKKPVNINVPFKQRMMCLNESTFNPFQHLRQEFIEQLESVPLNRYFNSITSTLKKELSDYAGIPEECIVFGNGADEMLYYLFNAVRENNHSFAVSLSPSYFDYKSYSSAVGLGIKFLNLDNNFDFRVEDYLELAAQEDCKLCILCNPNNPTGNLLARDKILKIILQSGKLVLIDETYYEFSCVTFKELLEKHDNLVIIRSFSKAFSAAGLRFGYLLSQPENIQEIKKVMTIFNLNLMTQAFVVSMLKNKEIFIKHNKQVIEQRDWLFQELARIPEIKIRNTATNFLLFSAGDKIDGLFDFLNKNEISLRPLGAHALLKDYLRVTISTAEDNIFFLSKLQEFLHLASN